MFQLFFYQPTYNILVFFLNIIPNHDVGIAIILTTIFIKIILLPLNLKAQESQYVMREMEGEMRGLKEKNKNDHKKYGEELMLLYKTKNVSPFSSLLLLFIQIPIFFALFFVFQSGIKFDQTSIYSFVSFPDKINLLAFGLFDLSKAYWWIGVLCGVSMYVYTKKQSDLMKRISAVLKSKKEKENKQENNTKMESFSEIFAKNMNFQMVYFFPIISGITAAYFPAALGVYWTTSNILSIFQDFYIQKKLNIEGFIKKHS